MATVVENKELFAAVQMAGVFEDSKTFPDLEPTKSMAEISRNFNKAKRQLGFDIKKFVNENFEPKLQIKEIYASHKSIGPENHIHGLWGFLTKSTPNHSPDSTLISLPKPFVVPGGRFQEVYYWDSYFTMLGLIISKKYELVENMIENFAYLIDTFGFIPNGNRTYFLSRSQPPFFSLMVKLLDTFPSVKKTKDYLPQLLKEYDFWMSKRAIKMPGGEILNRYYDDDASPRPESYREDVELAENAAQKPESLFLNLRAACESGWDFSSRWLENADDLGTINTSEIVPVDLNCLLFHLEKMISEISPEKHYAFEIKAESRKNAIEKYFWNDEQEFFCDFDLKQEMHRENLTLAGVYPLYFEISKKEKAEKVAEKIKNEFLKKGGLITTTTVSEQQWDAPNGWAPLQWMAFVGLKNYGFTDLSEKIQTNWLTLNEKIFATEGKFTEKYNVSSEETTGGGEYPNQDGFGWTNGVYLAMKHGGLF